MLNRTKKLAVTGCVALAAGAATMSLLHRFGPGHFATASAGTPWTHSTLPAPLEMGWARLWDRPRWRCGLVEYWG
jgi:hypothetical protein